MRKSSSSASASLWRASSNNPNVSNKESTSQATTFSQEQQQEIRRLDLEQQDLSHIPSSPPTPLPSPAPTHCPQPHPHPQPSSFVPRPPLPHRPDPSFVSTRRPSAAIRDITPLKDAELLSDSRYPNFLRGYEPSTVNHPPRRSSNSNISQSKLLEGIAITSEKSGQLPPSDRSKKQFLDRIKTSLKKIGHDLKQGSPRDDMKALISRPIADITTKRSIWAGRGNLINLGSLGAGEVTVPEGEGRVEGPWAELKRCMVESRAQKQRLSECDQDMDNSSPSEYSQTEGQEGSGKPEDKTLVEDKSLVPKALNMKKIRET